MSKCISVHGEFSEHEYTGQNPTCDYCGQVSEMIAVDQLQMTRAALVAIQELHKPRFIGTETDGTPIYACLMCLGTKPGECPTRRLADDALGGETNG